MAIQYLGATLYVAQSTPSSGAVVSGFPGSKYNTQGYMEYSSDKYYPIGYSGNSYIVRLTFNTSTPLTSFTLKITAGGTENTSSTQKHRMIVSRNSTYGTLSAADFAALSGAIDIHFSEGAYSTLTLVYNGNISAGDFYVYLGPSSSNIGTSTRFSLIYARESTSTYNKFAFTGTVPTSYTISYNANGGSGTTNSQTKYHDVNLTLSNNNFNPPNPTSKTLTITLQNENTTTKKTVINKISKKFSKWNTKSDGKGTSYNAGANYTQNASATMYAQWIDGDVTKGTVELGTATKTTSRPPLVLTLKLWEDLDIIYSLTKSISYTFKEWNTNSNGSGQSYDSGNHSFDADTTLYAIFNSSESLPSVKLPTNITRDGYTFKGWSISPTDNPLKSGSYSPSTDTTLYALWEGSGAEKGMYIYTNNKWNKVSSVATIK